MSERRACAVVAQSRSTHRYRARRRPIPGLQERMIELAHVRPRFGYPRLHVLLRREGFLVNRKRVRSEEHTSELQSHSDLVCRLLLEKKKKNNSSSHRY